MADVPEHFVGKDPQTGWAGTKRAVHFDRQATLTRDATQQLLDEHCRLTADLTRLAWDPHSTRQQFRDLADSSD